MKFVGMNEAEKKMLLEALQMVWAGRRECLESCKPRPDMKDAKPEVIAAYKEDVALAEKLYNTVERSTLDHSCVHPSCDGQVTDVTCTVCRSY